MDIGLLYFFAVGGLGVIGLMMAGWSSFNKYSLLGGLRAAAAIISYELPLILGVGRRDHARRHAEPEPDRGEPGRQRSATGTSSSSRSAFIVFFIAATAEGSRTPFDLTEADSEIVAGFATEYSGMRFGFFFFAEYVNMFILSALTVGPVPGRLERAASTSQPILDWLQHHRQPGARPRPAWASGLLWIVAARRRRSSSCVLALLDLDAQAAAGRS